MQTIQKEIKESVYLCRPNGALNPEAIGWARRPFPICNLKGSPFRKKRWNYWCIADENFLFSVTIADLDYAESVFAYALDFRHQRFTEQTAILPFPGKTKLPPGFGGKVEMDIKGLRARFEDMPAGRLLSCRSEDFGGTVLTAEVKVEIPADEESLNVVVPWSRRRFQFTSKQLCLPATGKVQWGSELYEFKKGRAFATLDLGRGIWPFQTSWNWAAFSGNAGRDRVGVNMGARWTDGTGMNENGILLNGKLFKIFDDIVFQYDEQDLKGPWSMRTKSSSALELDFQPFHERVAETNLLLLRTKVNQLFGLYSGRVRVGRKELKINQLFGWAEDHRARW